MKFYYSLFFLFWIFFLVGSVDAAHFIVGRVNDAKDGTPANDHKVVLWNPANGIDDNLTDTIGPNGNSNVDNVYMIDCELLDSSCKVGDEIRVGVMNTGDGYATAYVSVIVTGAGYDVMGNLTLNTPPNITSLVVDDALTSPSDEIDLIAASARKVTCQAIVEDLDSDVLQNASAEFFDSVVSGYGNQDDNNTHYTNASCFVNSSYGNENQSEVVCGFDVLYYANPQQWDCVLSVEDDASARANDSDSTSINSLLSVGLPPVVDFGIVGGLKVSNESEINVTNYGNVQLNISLSGYAMSEGDGSAMNCTGGFLGNISLEYAKYNLTTSTSGSLTFQEFELGYANLTSLPVVKEFNLPYRQNDAENEAINSTYWRIYVPLGVEGTCSGNILVGAVQSEGS